MIDLEKLKPILDGYKTYFPAHCKEESLASLIHSVLNERCYPDPKMKTVTMDVGFYLSRFYLEQKKSRQEKEG